MTRFYTVDFDEEGGEVLDEERALYLASEHAREGTRILNEVAHEVGEKKMSANFVASMASTHAQLALAWSEIASAQIKRAPVPFKVREAIQRLVSYSWSAEEGDWERNKDELSAPEDHIFHYIKCIDKWLAAPK